jgi:hypothetical protein
MLEGRAPEQSVIDLNTFDILSLLYKFPEGCPELESKELQDSLIRKSVQMCKTLG